MRRWTAGSRVSIDVIRTRWPGFKSHNVSVPLLAITDVNDNRYYILVEGVAANDDGVAARAGGDYVNRDLGQGLDPVEIVAGLGR